MNVQKHDLRNNHILLKILISLRKSNTYSGLTDSKSDIWPYKVKGLTDTDIVPSHTTIFSVLYIDLTLLYDRIRKRV